MKIIYICLGILSLVLGMLGIILPILPTTPFLLLSAFLFSKSSSRLHEWLIQTTLYKKYIHELVVSKQITREKRNCSLMSVSFIFMISMMITPIWIGKLCLLLVMCIHHYIMLTKVRVIDEE